MKVNAIRQAMRAKKAELVADGIWEEQISDDDLLDLVMLPKLTSDRVIELIDFRKEYYE